MRYFAKRDVNVLPPGLKAAQFEKLLPGYGHIATADAAVLKIIDAVLGKTGGFTEITKAQWDETVELAKKNALSKTPTPGDPRNVLPQLKPSAAGLERAVAAGIDAPPPPPHAEAPAPPASEPTPTVRKGPLFKKQPPAA